MEKLKAKKGGIFCAAVLINLVLAAVLFLVFHSAYENNDDVGVMIRALGAKGVYEPHLIYVNYVCGLLLTSLYRFWQRIPWHALVQYCLLFAAFTAVVYVVLKRAKHAAIVWITMFVLFFFAYDGYIRLQYTKTAGIISCCGIFLLLFAVENERTNLLALIGGYGLACFGFMYRNTQFLAEGALMTGAAVYLLIDLRNQDKAQRFRIFRKYLLACVGLVLCLAVLTGIDRKAYSSEEWKEFNHFNELRTELFDYGFPDYGTHKEEYKALGINKNAFKLFRGGNTMDTEKFNVEIMQKLVDMKEKKHLSKSTIKGFLDTIPKGLFENRTFYCFLILLFFRLLYPGKRKGQMLLTVFYELAATGVLYFYLYYSGRYLLNRVDVGLWLAACLVLLWTFVQDEPYFTNRQGVFLLVALVLISQFSMRKNWRANTKDDSASYAQERALLESIHADQDHVYIAKMGTVSIFRAYDIYDGVPFGITQNIFQLGGWSGRTPSEVAIINDRGIKNPYPDLINSEVAYLLDTDKGIGSVIKYLHDYYDENAQAVEVKDFGLCKAYKIVSE